MNPPPRGTRIVGALTLVSSLAVVLSGIGEARGASWTGFVRVASLLLLLPAVALLARWGDARRPLVLVASACGAASLVLWAVAGTFVPWSWEWIWIALSAAWWLLLSGPLRAQHRRLGGFTLVVGVAATLDAVATLLEGRLPPFITGLAGGWKIPLALVWQSWVGAWMIRAAP